MVPWIHTAVITVALGASPSEPTPSQTLLLNGAAVAQAGETEEPAIDYTVLQGRIWTEDRLDRLSLDPSAAGQAMLDFTPGAHVDARGTLWLAGSAVHTMLIDGHPYDVDSRR